MKENLHRVFTELSDADTKGVAISSPGAVDTEEGVIKGFSAIPYIHNFKIIDELEAMFGLPVTIEMMLTVLALLKVNLVSEKIAKINLFHSWDRYWWCSLP